MLTVDVLKQNSALAGLTDTQLSAIAEMSKNDENVVIGNKIGALHGQYDNDIFSITGIKKNDGEKSYDYAKRVVKDYKEKAESAKQIEDKLTAAEKQVKELQTKLANNAGDDVLRQQLNDAKTQVSQLQAQLTQKDSDFNAAKDKYDTDIKNIHVEYAFQQAVSGIKFKSGITESIQKTLLSAAKAEVLAKGNPDFIDDGNGGKKLIIRGSDGNILNNPKNNLNPYTIKELVMETSLKDALDTQRTVTGGGTGSGDNGGNNTLLDLTGAKNQIEADRIIENYLLTNGITRDSKEFSEQSLKLRNENNVSNLPIR